MHEAAGVVGDSPAGRFLVEELPLRRVLGVSTEQTSYLDFE
jgi:hypothetical protein